MDSESDPPNVYYAKKSQWWVIVYGQNFYGGGGGGRGGGWRGGSSEGCLNWGSGVIQKHLKTGVGKGKSCSQGEGVLKVLLPLLPSENCNHALWMSFLTDNSAKATKIFIVSSNIGVHPI